MRVVVADGSALAREELAALLDRAGLSVAACAGSVEELVRLVAATRPDLVVSAADLPAGPTGDRAGAGPGGGGPGGGTPGGRPSGGGGPGGRPAGGGLLRLRRLHPATPLLVLAAAPGAADRARELVEPGVRGFGFLVRDRVAGTTALLEAAALVAAGGSAVDPEVVARLLTPVRGPLAALSRRERDVLALLAAGRSNSAIAARLWLTPRTVEGHVRSIFVKLRLPAGPDDHRRVLAARVYLAQEDRC